MFGQCKQCGFQAGIFGLEAGLCKQCLQKNIESANTSITDKGARTGLANDTPELDQSNRISPGQSAQRIKPDSTITIASNLSKRIEGIKGLGIGLGIIALCGLGVVLYFYLLGYYLPEDGLATTIFRFFAPFAIFFAVILGAAITLTSLGQAITGKGDVLNRIKKAFRD